MYMQVRIYTRPVHAAIYIYSISTYAAYVHVIYLTLGFTRSFRAQKLLRARAAGKIGCKMFRPAPGFFS